MLFLGIDGGGTKTEFTLCDETGKVLAKEVMGSASHWQYGTQKLKDTLKDGVEGVLSKSENDFKDIVAIGFGMSGFGEDPNRDKVSVALCREFFENKPMRICNDVEVGFIASLGLEPGINVVCGTGSMAFGMDDTGATDRSGGWGHEMGDEGSGVWLGKKFLELFAKQSDGRIKRTMMYDMTRNEFDLDDDFGIITIFHDKYYQNRSKIASLQNLLSKAAKQGDENALSAYSDSAYECAILAKALRGKMNFKEPIKVSYSGGVFKGGDYMVGPFREYIEKFGFEFCEPKFSPDQGSIILAAQQVDMYRKLMDNLSKKYSGRI